jgi:hypothetical protein
MAIDCVMYHGSPFREKRQSYGASGNRIPLVAPGRPFFVTSALPYAINFARGGLVSMVRLNADNVIDFHDSSVVDRLLAIYNEDPHILSSDGRWDKDVEGDIHDSSYRLLDSPAVMSKLISEGVEAIYVPEDIELNITSYAILNPKAVEFLKVVRGREIRPDIEEGLAG